MSVVRCEVAAARRQVASAGVQRTPILVQKFGGSSLSTPAKLRAVAGRVVAAKRRGYSVVAVVSAMGDATDDLLALAREVSESPLPRELDVLLATGEAVSAALLAMAVQDLGERAVSFSGGACGIVTNAVHGNARILEVHPAPVRAALAQDVIVVATGFQGVSAAGEVTTLGRGGSDTTAVALAAALDAEHCEIYTDVEGVFSADPRRVPAARRIEAISSDELEEFAWNGAQVVKAEAVEFAADNHVPLLVASTFGAGGGTLIHPSTAGAERFRPRVSEVAGVAGRKDLLRLAVPAALCPSARAELQSMIGCYDLVFGALGAPDEPGELYLSTLEMIDPCQFAKDLQARCGAAIEVEVGLGAVSIVGFGLGSRPEALFDAARCVEEAGGRVRRNFTGRESLTFVLPAEQVDRCVMELHRAYIEKRLPAATACENGGVPLGAAWSAGKGSYMANLETFERLESEVRSYCRSFPTVFARARASTLWDEEGRSYLDFFAGAGALNYGHNEPRLKRRLIEYLQAEGVLHSLDMATAAKRSFLERFERVILRPRGFDYKVQFPGPTGTNAVEAALKLARKVTGRPDVIYFQNAYHGMTLGALAVTSNPAKRAAAGVPLPHAMAVPFDGDLGPGVDTLGSLDRLLTETRDAGTRPAAVIVETVQAEGGVRVASWEWLRGLRELTRRQGVLLIVDDVQAGCGRTGTFFSFEPAGIEPDLVLLSKSIGGCGLPLSLVLLRRDLDRWQPGEHNGTFRGQNLSFVAGTEALSYWEDDTFAAAVRAKGEHLRQRLEALVAAHPRACRGARGRGLMQGLVLDPLGLGVAVAEAAFERGLLIEPVGPQDEVLKFLPPLVVTQDELDAAVAIVEASLTAALDGSLSEVAGARATRSSGCD